jgi:hypothetical protein
VVDKPTFAANGLWADTGKPLDVLPARAVAAAQAQPVAKSERDVVRRKRFQANNQTFGVVADVDQGKLEEAGWAVLFPAVADGRIKEALAPLLALRKAQAGRLYREFECDQGYQPGETCADWLTRHGVSMAPVDPVKGVPFYLLIVGPPADIPFEFQYMLDIFWAVGRVSFDDIEDYRRYADSVVAYETTPPETAKRSTIFATKHDYDAATQLLSEEVALPLANGDADRGPVGQRQGFGVDQFIGAAATKSALADLLRGKSAGGRPSLLFTGTHGVAFEADDPRLPAGQGALVCQDFPNQGQLDRGHWFEAADVPADANVHGLVHFMFACYGGGCPQLDQFADPGQQPRPIAPRPLVSKLPQALMAHPNGGALAVVGHVDRAWSYSFHSACGVPQAQAFRDVLTRLVKGDRLGWAMDQFDVRWAALSAELADTQRDISFGKQVPDWELGALWAARNDARNYVVLGDPAVRIRVEDLK